MWLKPQGYSVIVSPEPSMANLDGFQRAKVCVGNTEFDTATCNHCNRVFHVGARLRPDDIGGLCKCCMKIICPDCLDKGCLPFEKNIEQQEAKGRAVKEWF